MGECRLITGEFAIFIQALMASICVVTLAVKRELEQPRRPFVVWFLDLLKQGLSSLTGHSLNILIAIYISSISFSVDQCQWYCISYLFDIIVGTLYNLSVLALFESLFAKAHIPLRMGDYGDPPSCLYWIPQFALWMLIVVSGKILIFGCQYLFFNDLLDLSSYLFRYVRPYPRLELFLVMIVVPMFFNSLQFWMTDSFLKNKPDATTASTSTTSEPLLVQKQGFAAVSATDLDLDGGIITPLSRSPSNGRFHYELLDMASNL